MVKAILSVGCVQGQRRKRRRRASMMPGPSPAHDGTIWSREASRAMPHTGQTSATRVSAERQPKQMITPPLTMLISPNESGAVTPFDRMRGASASATHPLSSRSHVNRPAGSHGMSVCDVCLAWLSACRRRVDSGASLSDGTPRTVGGVSRRPRSARRGPITARAACTQAAGRACRPRGG